MFQRIGKRVTSFLLILAMILSMSPIVPVVPVTKVNATTLSLLDSQLSIADTANSMSQSNGVVTVTAKGSLFSKKTNTVTITNTSGAQAELSFTYAATNYNSFKIAGVGASSGTYTVLLAAEGTLTLELVSNSGLSNTTATLTLSNITLTAAAAASNVTITYDSAYGNVTSNSVNIPAGTVQEGVTVADGITLTAAATNGATFLGWINKGNGTVLSKDATFTLKPSAEMIVEAVFAKDGGKGWYMVGGTTQKSQSIGLLSMSKRYYYEVSGSQLFDDLNTAATAAAANGYTVVLMNSTTLAAGTYTIPSGVTLLIPFDSANSMFTTEAMSFDQGVAFVQPTAYRTLTLADGANLVINGAMSVSGKHFVANGGRDYGCAPGGPTGFVQMQGNSKITVNSGAALYAYGYVTGSGEVEIKSGATVYELFQVGDYRGGDGTSNLGSSNSDKGVFPLSQYYIQNVEVPMYIHAGATEYSYASIYASGINASSVEFIGASGMFQLTSGYAVKSYDGTRDRMVVEAFGDMSISTLTVDMGTANVNTSKFMLGIHGGITVNVHAGNFQINQNLALLPGAEVMIGKDATCTMGSAIKAIVYDADEWGEYCGATAPNTKFNPVKYSPSRQYTRTEADLVDATVVVKGKFDATNGYLYSTAGGANITGVEGGIIITRPETSTKVTYQAKQSAEDGNQVFTFVEIPIKPVILQNLNGTVLDTATNTSLNTYVYVDNFWRCEQTHIWDAGKFTVNPTCTDAGEKLFTCITCGATRTEVAPAIGHADANTDHACDNGCDTYMGTHADAANDADHVCDYGCGAVMEDCADKTGDGDHNCDICGAESVSDHTYNDPTCESAATCTECGTFTGEALGHLDTDKNHACERCGAEMGTHVDSVGDGNHVCDYGCGVVMSECFDSATDKDHKCDECSKDNVTEHEWIAATCTVAKTCSVCGATEGDPLGHDLTEATCSAPATCKRGCGYTEGETLPHTPVIDEGYPAFCTETGRTEGSHCDVCGEILVEQEIIPMRGHDIQQRDAKIPTYSNVGWEAYEECTRCAYSTYVEIPALEVPDVVSYEDFVYNLGLLEELAYAFIQENPGKDPVDLVIKYIRTGVDRYNSASWGIMAGYENSDFAKFVARKEDEINSQVESVDQMICISSMKNIVNFTLPNGDLVDFGHMVGTMDITYHNKNSQNHADVGGWAGDLVDLLSTADRHGVTGTVEEMVSELTDKYFNAFLNEADIFSLTDTYGDLDAHYIMLTLQEQEYEMGMLSTIMQEYFTAELTDTDRAAYFLEKRLDNVSTRGDIRAAVYNAYMGNKMIKTLEDTRTFEADDLSDMRKACCYTFADYLCRLAGDYIDSVENPYYADFSSESSNLAPGITQKINMATTADGNQMVYYVATADLTRDDVHIFANYNNNDPAAGWAMQRVLDQANAAQNKYGDPESEHYIENYNVIASVNGAGFNMYTGEPSGLLVMGGVEYHAINSNGFIGVLKDGTPVVGTTEEYNTIYKDQVAEGIAIFGATLIKDGEICVDKSDTYYNNRAGRTAFGITKTGKVVYMVLDGRQGEWSCGGSMEEIAQIMLEAGCVQAVNLDGGGSTTYVAKQEGEDALSVVNRPSDGMERSVSTSLLMVSTAPSSTAFDHAILESETSYLTVGSSLKITPSGVSATGNAAELPEGTTWALSDDQWATITEDGVLTALRTGDVDVNLMLGEEVIGTKTFHIVQPNQLYFTRDSLNAVYGQTIDLPVKALFEGKPVTILASDLTFSLSTATAGAVDGFTFVGDEASGIKMVVVTAALASNSEVTASITINLYRQGENSFDFDQATGGTPQFAWNREVSNSTTQDAFTYTVIEQDQDMVTSYVFAIDMTQIPIPTQLEDLVYMLPGADLENASAWNFLLQLAERVSVLSEVKPVIYFDPNVDVDYSELKLITEYFTLEGTEFDEATNALTLTLKWIKQSMPIDPATANPLCLVNGIKLTPKDDAPWDAKSQLKVVNAGEISYKIYLRASGLYSFAQKEENQQIYGLYAYENPDNAADKGGYFGDVYTTFEDSYILVNSVKDGWYNEEGGFTYYNKGEKYFGIHKIDGLYYDFGENGVNIGQTPYSGLFNENGHRYYAKNGELVTGWQTIGEDWYLFSWADHYGVDGIFTATIDGVDVTYEMDHGRIVKGFWDITEAGRRYFYGPWFYSQGMKNIEGQTYYFEDNYAVTGIYPVAGAHAVKPTWYEFTETGALIGIVADGVYWHEGDLYYVKDGSSDHVGLYCVNGDYYYFQDNNKAVLNKTYWITTTNDLLPAGYYRFGADGKILMEDAVVNEDGVLYYYHNGMRATSAGLVLCNGYYYFVCNGAGQVTVSETLWVWEGNGLMKEGTYTFGADGKMYLHNQIVNGYYYYESERTEVGLIQLDGAYYYAEHNGKIVVNKTYKVTQTNGLLTAGTYRFDANGKIIMTTGIVEENGKLYYYENGMRAEGAGVVNVDGSYYYVDGRGIVAAGKSAWVSNTNGLVAAGVYTFAADGKMVQ